MPADGAVGLVVRTARAVSAPAALLAALVLVGCALTTAAPAVAAAWATTALRDDVAAAPLAGREIATSWVGGPGGPSWYQFEPAPTGTDDSWARLAGDLDAVRASMGAELRAVTAPAQALAVSGRGQVQPSATSPGAQTSQVALVADPSLADDARLVAGAWPGEAGRDRVVPIALSEAVARAASWSLGETRDVAFPGNGDVQLELTGTIAPVRADAAVWGHTSGLLEPSYLPVGQGRILDVQAIVSTGAWVALQPVTGAARTTAWFAVDGEALDAGRAAVLARQVRALVGGDPPAIGTGGGTAPLSSRLPAGLDAFFGRQAVLTRLCTVAVAGPAAAGLATLVLGSMLVGRRLDAGTRLLAARGASRGQVAALRAGAVAIWVAPAALAGLAVGSVPAGHWPTGAAMVVAALVAVCAAVVGTPPVGRRTAAWVRAVAVAAVATVGLVAVLAVVRADGDDPLLVLAAPALALAVGLVAWRGLAWALRALARLGMARPSLTGALGPVRARSGGASAGAALLALVLGVALAVLSGAMLTTLRTGVGDSARREVGADLRVEPWGGFGPQQVAQVAATPGVRAAVPVTTVQGVIARVGTGTEPVAVVVVDTALLGDLWAGSSGAGSLPRLPERSAGSTPVIASPWFTAAVGDGEASIRGHTLAPVAAGTDTIALTGGKQWIVVDAADADDLLGSTLTADLVLVALTRDAQPDAVASAVRSLADPAPTVVAARDVVAARLAGPDVAGLIATVVAAVVASAVLGALALATGVALRTGERRRLTGLLGAFGLRRREARALATWEAVPVAVAGVVAGALAGVGLARFVVPATDLAAFTGGPTASRLSPGLTAALVAVVALVAGGAVALSAWLVRDGDPARALREMAGG
jgi:putative ABC transport system permease protein